MGVLRLHPIALPKFQNIRLKCNVLLHFIVHTKASKYLKHENVEMVMACEIEKTFNMNAVAAPTFDNITKINAHIKHENFGITSVCLMNMNSIE